MLPSQTIFRKNETTKLIDKYLRKYFKSLKLTNKEPIQLSWLKLRIYSIVEDYYVSTYKHKFNVLVLTHNDINYIRSVVRKEKAFNTFFKLLTEGDKYKCNKNLIDTYLTAIYDNLHFCVKSEYTYEKSSKQIYSAIQGTW